LLPHVGLPTGAGAAIGVPVVGHRNTPAALTPANTEPFELVPER
jgi:hypothetical protein